MGSAKTSPGGSASSLLEELASRKIDIRESSLVRNAVWNFVGQASPMLVALVTIPILIKQLGTERFGVLTLIWMVVGYFSLFDLGLGRALTQLVARKLGSGDEREVPGVIWTGMGLMWAMALMGTLVAILLSPWLVRLALKISVPLQHETLSAFYLLAVCVPVVVSTTGFRGVLEAYQRFGIINAVRVPLGVFTFAGPLLVLPFSRSLFPVVAILAVARLVNCLIYGVACLRTVPGLDRRVSLRGTLVKPLLGFGGWFSVSNIVGPILLYSDRFLIAHLMSASVVAYYTVPFDVVFRLVLIPGAILGVFFPAFSFSFGQSSSRAKHLYAQAMKYMFALMLPIVVAVVLFSGKGLALWLGSDFALRSSRVAQFLAVGVFINSLGLVSQSVVQAAGWPDLTAKLHLIELPLYTIYLWSLIGAYGITGAAVAWVIRVTISTIVLAFMARRCLGTAAGRATEKGISELPYA